MAERRTTALKEPRCLVGWPLSANVKDRSGSISDSRVRLRASNERRHPGFSETVSQVFHLAGAVFTLYDTRRTTRRASIGPPDSKIGLSLATIPEKSIVELIGVFRE